MGIVYKTGIAVLIGVLLGWSTEALSTTFEQLSLERLTHHSSHVVRGKFVGTESMWTEDKSAIYTRVVFHVDETVIGRMSGKEIVLYLPGGTVGDTTTFVIGAPEVELDRDSVLMLNAVAGKDATARSGGLPAFNIVGLSQGLFDLKQDPKTDKTIATSHAARFLDASQLEEGRLPGGAEGIMLDDLVIQIREIVARTDDKAMEPGDEGAGEKGNPEEEMGEPGADEGEEGKPDAKAKEEGSDEGEDEPKEGVEK